MIKISYYQAGKQRFYHSYNIELALERKAILIHNYGKSAFSGVSWFTIETDENQHLGFLQKEQL